jgi:hypothetical protein
MAMLNNCLTKGYIIRTYWDATQSLQMPFEHTGMTSLFIADGQHR